ncbi:hypothetical protein ACES2L_04925 [Bdellovibrio bacteriovorus]
MKIVVCVLTLIFAFQAHALTAEEFTADFVEQTNHRLKFVNEERTSKNKQAYCAELSQEQITAVHKLATTTEMTVGKFLEVLSKDLKCYPMFWAPWGTENLAGLVFNSKASMMDLLLINDVLIDLNEGSAPKSEEYLLNSYSRFPFN